MIIASPVDKIILGRMFKEELGGWFVTAFIDMARRQEPPTLLEGRRLGVDDLVLIGQLHHRFRNLPFTTGTRKFVEAALKTPDMVMHISGPRSIDTECKFVRLNLPSNSLI
jgi:hypothetical protein